MTINDTSTNVTETAVRGVEAIHKIVVERDQLLTENDRLKSDLMLMTERAKQFESRLADATTERDHYMRYATELTVRLTDIQSLVGNCIESAKIAAFRPEAVPVPKLSNHDSEALEKDASNLKGLLNRLHKNGGEAVAS